MATTAIPATMPPTMGPVFELFPLESGEPVDVGEVLPVAPAGWAEELKGSTGTPAGTSGVSENTGLQLSTKSGVDNPYHQWSSGPRFVGTPTILKLACAVSSCRIYNG